MALVPAWSCNGSAGVVDCGIKHRSSRKYVERLLEVAS